MKCDKYRLSQLARIHMHKVLAQSLDRFREEVRESHPDVRDFSEDEMGMLKLTYMEHIIKLASDMFNEGANE